MTYDAISRCFSFSITINRVLTAYISASRCRDLYVASRSLIRPTRDAGAAFRRTLTRGVAPGVLLGLGMSAWQTYDLLDGKNELNDVIPLVCLLGVFLLLIVTTIASTA